MATSDSQNPGGHASGQSPSTGGSHPGVVGRVIGDFEIRREIGRGGMGTVYEAWQRSLNRVVAIKVLANSLGLTGNAIQRFQREAQAAGKLHHANIVPIYSQGEDDGVYYYVMELIRGRGLNEIINEARGGPMAGSTDQTETKVVLGSGSGAEKSGAAQPARTVKATVACGVGASSGAATPALSDSTIEHFDRIARMMAAAATALHYAHERGVIHRDIKPHNLIIGDNGRLYITDFGLARVLEQPGMTTTGEFIGSPLYMSPEQITGGQVPVDHRTDIYSLGATMYEWMTSTPPFPGVTREQVISRIISSESTPPRSIVPEIPVDLETVCIKALEKAPGERYKSADEMANDLNRFLNRDSIHAKREGTLARGRKFIARNPTGVLAVAVVIVAVVSAVVITSSVQSRKMNEQTAEQQRLAEAALAPGPTPIDEPAMPEFVASVRDPRNDPDILEVILNSSDFVKTNIPCLRFEINPEGIVSVQPIKPTLFVVTGEGIGQAEVVFSADDGRSETLKFVVNPAPSNSIVVRSIEQSLPEAVRAGSEFLSNLGKRLTVLRPADDGGSIRIGTNGAPDDLPLITEQDRVLIGELSREFVEDLKNVAAYGVRIRTSGSPLTQAAEELYYEALVEPDTFKALALVEDALHTDWSHADALHLRAILHCKLFDFASAAQYAELMFISAEQSPAAYLMRGLAQLFSGDYKNSIEDFTQALAGDPDNPAVFVARGAAHTRAGVFLLAVADLDQALALAPQYRAAELERSFLLSRLPVALQSLTEVIEGEPENHQALVRRGDVHLLREEFDLAITDYESASRISGTVPPELLAKLLLANKMRLERNRNRPAADRRSDNAPDASTPVVPAPPAPTDSKRFGFVWPPTLFP